MILAILFGLCVFGTSTRTAYAKEVCYHGVFCFNDNPPFNNAHNVLPKSPEDVGTQFLLFTPTFPARGANKTVIVDWRNSSSLGNTSFDPALPVKVIIHGFSNTIETEWLYLMKDAFLQKSDVNVFITAWGPGAAAPNYDQAVANTRLVAMQLSMLLGNVNKLGVNYKDMHLIGHSLGSHISGYVGSIIKESNNTLGRISGMDPAEPGFQGLPLSVRLDKNDAEFVDVIHSNGAPISKGGFGMRDPCGHVDFFLNGGDDQPDCSTSGKAIASIVGSLLNGRRFLADMFQSLFDGVACSHGRSHEVFTESIKLQDDCLFTAYPCESYAAFQKGECLSCGDTGCGIMGNGAIDYDARGSFYLNTRMGTPFCGHHYGVNVTIGGNKTENGRLEMMLDSAWGETEWMNLTGSDRHFIPMELYRTVALTKDVVGNLQSVSLKYTSGGKPPIFVDRISIQSGDSGLSYAACVQRELLPGQPIKLSLSDGGSCH